MGFCRADSAARVGKMQILRPANPMNNLRCSWGPRLAGSQDDTALGCRKKWTTGDVL
jgi:hypothetical protein